MASGVNKQKWWKEAVVFQIYPASFMDSNNDGWGDVKGITSKIDYLKDLGADVVWTSPIYKSPQADMGYDISDYKDIDHRYGTLEDVDDLISELKKRDMKLMMDLVVNHTSNEHAWFLESKSSLDNPKRDWYIWQKPKFDNNGKHHPPNNWSMILGEANSAWTFDEHTGEYYLSLFTAEQPDLNWENPDVREAVHDVLRFWLDRGVSGFRMDVINLISKVKGFPDAEVVAPDHEFQPGHKHYTNGPRLHEYLKEMNRKVLSKYDTITVGEMPFVKDENEIIKAVGANEEELNMIFLFDLVDVDNEPGKFRLSLYDWPRREIGDILSKHQRLMIDRDGWNTVFVENHDNPRSVTRYTDDSDEYRELGSKLLCMMLTTLGGTLYVYQGQELGMRNVPPAWPPEEYKDIETVNYWKKSLSMYPNDKKELGYSREIMQRKARDSSRTPVQWSSAPHGGFTGPEVEPWMRVNDDYETVNAAVQLANKDPNTLSVLQFWQRGLENRKRHKEAFVYGDFERVDNGHPQVFAYERASEKDGSWLVVLNFSKDEIDFRLPEEIKVDSWVAGNYTAGKPDKSVSGLVKLLPWEGLLAQCKAK